MAWISLGYAALALAMLCLCLPGRRVYRGFYLASAWAASLLVLIGAGLAWSANQSQLSVTLQLSILPSYGVALDPVRAFFLLITVAVYALSIAFLVRDSARYSPARGRVLLAWATVLYAAMIAVLLSATILSLLFTWEVMSLTLWVLVSFDTHSLERVRAGYVTLALSEAGALAALAGLLILGKAAGTADLAGMGAVADGLPTGVIWAGFLLTFFGFGVKTGIAPVNIWMSNGYAAAPRGLRPLFSGATMNLGVFTLWLVDGPLASHALWPALVVLIVGSLTAVLGIVYALIENDLPRVLTQSSIENFGIVVAGLGAGFAFAALGHPALAGMAMVAGLYHMLNHSAYKTLLFLGSGGIEAATGTHELDRLGGLLRRLPLFGSLFLLGTLAIAALPPFNGFVSEWLTLESLLRVVEISAVPVRITFALCGALLALTAGLGMTCFVMLSGTSLLGIPRSREAARIDHMPMSVTLPMTVLGVICLGLGVLATGIIPVLGELVAPLAGRNPTDTLVPAFFHSVPHLAASIVTDLTHIGARVGQGILPLRGLVVMHSGGTATPVVFAMSTGLSFVVIATLLLIVWGTARWFRRRRTRYAKVWDAGLSRLRPEMTYNATGFTAPVRAVFSALLRPVVSEQVERKGAFATAVRRREYMAHIVDRFTLDPLISQIRAIATWIAQLHHGRMNMYAGYILLVLIVALLTASATLH